MSRTASPTSDPPRRRVFRSLGDRLWAMSRPRVPRLVYTNGGLGDELMLTAIAHTARAAGQPLHVLTNLPEVWQGNADAGSVQTDVERWFYAQRRGWIDSEIVHLGYESTRAGRHIAQQMADHLGLLLPPAWRPVLPAARPATARHPRRIVIQNSCRGARYAATTKEWAQAHWLTLCARLAGYELVQLGSVHDPALPVTTDLRGKTTLIGAAEMLASAACFVGLESGLMHVAAAMHTPAVIVHGGRTAPTQTGYPFHRHITRQPPCAGCALNTGCPHDLVCLAIPPEEVLDAVQQSLRASS